MNPLYWLMALSFFMRHETPANDQTFTGYFSESMKIDTTTLSCEAQPNALLFKFQRDSGHVSNNMFLYGLIKCPAVYQNELFAYGRKLKLTYRQWKRSDLENVEVLNKHKFFNVSFYLITSIREVERE